MKIAVVSPSPIPYTRGGVENLSAGLFMAINRYTGHSAELIKVPIRENSAINLLKAYFSFSRINLNQFDLVISVKYPAWMIRHPFHMIYMCHRLRGLYDTYPAELKSKKWYRMPLQAFPGPLIRKIVHFLDNRAVNPSRIFSTFAISGTVAGREGYFHEHLLPEVIYPPSAREMLDTGPREHFFTVSRLDAPKRIDLLIQAYRRSDSRYPFIIAGGGPQREYLNYLAEGDDRIRFAGEVADDQLWDLYRRSLAVLYAPHAEDYGYITIEAMKFGKPVITTLDSGGPMEFVENGITGFAVLPDPDEIATKINKLASDDTIAAAMEKNVQEKVRDITWPVTVKKLLRGFEGWPDRRQRQSRDRFRLLVLVPYGVFPPRSGGQRRVASIYTQLADIYDVWILALSQDCKAMVTRELGPWLHEIQVPVSPLHAEQQWALEKAAGVAISDVALPELIQYSPNFSRVLNYFLACSDILISSHPYLHPQIQRTDRSRLVIHESHNFEFDLKSAVLTDVPNGKRLLTLVETAERSAVDNSDLLFVTSEDEGRKICGYYQREKNFTVIPNGVDTTEVIPAEITRKIQARRDMKLDDRPVVLFTGAWHPPNLEAFRFILETLSVQLTGIQFLIIGSVKDQYEARVGRMNEPENVRVLGVVDEASRLACLAASDLAVNPMFSGSGTNLKILEYFAAGLPVISTPQGIRGLDVEHRRHVMVAGPDDFTAAIQDLAGNQALCRDLSQAARHIVETRFDWKTIAGSMVEAIESQLSEPGSGVISIQDSQCFGYGWHGLEYWNKSDGGEKMPVRWSFGKSEVILPNPRTKIRLKLRLLGREKGVSVQVQSENGEELAAMNISGTWQDMEVPVPRMLGRDFYSIYLVSEEWSPAEEGSPDTRILGTAISGIHWETQF